MALVVGINCFEWVLHLSDDRAQATRCSSSLHELLSAAIEFWLNQFFLAAFDDAQHPKHRSAEQYLYAS